MVAFEPRDASGLGESLRSALLSALSEIAVALSSPAPDPRQIHLARRAAKCARSLSRLAPERLATLARATRRGVSMARRGFGGARNADVRVTTIRSLRELLPLDAHDRLASMVAEAPRDFESDRTRAANEIAALIRDWRLCDPETGVDDIVRAYSRTYRRGRRRMKLARASGTDELHRWRASVVDDEYQSGFLAMMDPTFARRAEGADRLRRLLGDINDLDALAAWIHERPDLDAEAKSALAHLRSAMSARRARLVEKAVGLGARIYADRPAQFRTAIAHLLMQPVER